MTFKKIKLIKSLYRGNKSRKTKEIESKLRKIKVKRKILDLSILNKSPETTQKLNDLSARYDRIYHLDSLF